MDNCIDVKNDDNIDSTVVEAVVLDTSLIHYILEYIDSDLKLLIHREGSSDADRSKVLSIGLIMSSGLEDYFKNVILSKRFKAKYCSECAKRGQLDSLKWAREMGCPWGEVDSKRMKLNSGGTCMEAAKAGHLHILKWLRKNGCPWNAWTCSAAAEAGHLDILVWAKEHGCRWKSSFMGGAAATGGHLHILKWLVANNCELNLYVCFWAAQGGHLHVLQWALENDFYMSSFVCSRAAFSGHLHILQWLVANGCEWNSHTCTEAALNGQLHVLQWARANGCDWSVDTCTAAAQGHLSTLQWLRANGCDWDARVCKVAARDGNMEILQWARANGCDWDLHTCRKAAEGGHFHILQLVRANGCEWDWKTCYAIAFLCNDDDQETMLLWCLNNGCPMSGSNDDASLELYPKNFNLFDYACQQDRSDICCLVIMHYFCQNVSSFQDDMMILIDSIPDDNDDLRICCMCIINGLTSTTSVKNTAGSSQTTDITLSTHLDADDDDGGDETSNSIVESSSNPVDTISSNNETK